MQDTGGTTKFISEWGNYFTNIDAVIVVIDSADVERFGDTADEMRYLLTVKVSQKHSSKSSLSLKTLTHGILLFS